MSTLIQLTDPHLVADGHPERADRLRAALDLVATAGIEVAALIVSGDLTDAGDPAAYRLLRSIVDPAAERIGTTPLYAMGNHDDRGALRSALLDLAPTTDPYDHVTRVGGLRIVVLDSTVPGRAHGRLDPPQLSWLATELERPAPLGTVLVLHHPPVPTSFAPMRGADLHDPGALAAVLAGTDVRMILCGHTHHTGASALAGVPVWIAPSVAHRVELLSPPGRARGRAGAGLSRIDIHPDAVVAAAEPLDGAELLLDVDTSVMVAAAGH